VVNSVRASLREHTRRYTENLNHQEHEKITNRHTDSDNHAIDPEGK